MPAPVRILRRSEIAALMTPAAYLDAVEIAFRSYATGNATVPAPMHIAARDGGFHVKGASVTLDRPYVAVKLNGNFPANRERIGLPTIQGALLLCDGSNGSVLAVMDSIEITSRRTAAATALAARYLARDDARSIAICGCGDQGRAQLTALAAILPLRCAKVWDIDFGCAHQFARDMRQSLELGDRHVLRHVDDRHQTRRVVRRRGQHFEAAEHCGRVRGDDLRGDQLAQLARDRGLAACRRPEEREDAQTATATCCAPWSSAMSLSGGSPGAPTGMKSSHSIPPVWRSRTPRARLGSTSALSPKTSAPAFHLHLCDNPSKELPHAQMFCRARTERNTDHAGAPGRFSRLAR